VSASEEKSAGAAIAEIEPWAETHSWPIAADQRVALTTYLETLSLWNRSVALVSRRDVATIATKHFADSWAVAAHLPPAASVVDLGAGSGFPGLVIAIADPGKRVCLVESIAKKVSFLSEVIRLAALRNARAVQQRAENAGASEEHRGHYDIATSRALGSLDLFLRLARPFLRPDAAAVAMNGPAYRQELETTDVAALGYRLESVREYLLPDSSERALLFFRIA
jgi:16S rRNA (guanine527-N7)-methyltransferase